MLQGNFSLSLHGSNPGLDCKTLFLDSYTLSGVVMRRATWSLAGASKVLPSLRELGNIVSLPPKLLQRLNKPPGSFPLNSREGGLPVIQLYVLVFGLYTW